MEKFKNLLLVLLLILSLAIFGIWGVNFAGGAFSEGVFVGQPETALPIFHLVAEFLMATLTLVGVIGFWRKKQWAKGLTLFGMGMFTYSAINSMGWAVINDPAQAIPMGITLIIVVAGLPFLIKYNQQ